MSFEIPFIRPIFPNSTVLAADVAEIVDSNWFTNFGPKERQFRKEVAGYLGGAHEVVTFSNATIALVGALSVFLGDRAPAGYVIVPSFTFAAGPQAIRWVGRQPLFIDIDEESLQPSLHAAEQACEQFGDQIAGILFCNTFGIGADDVHLWEELAARHAIPLVIDSAAGFGSHYPDGEKVGLRGDCEVFSFHATKPFAIGEGGAVVTRHPWAAQSLHSFSNFGFEGDAGAVREGLNGKLQEINAVIGLRQLGTIDDVVRERRDVLRRYRDILEPTARVAVVRNAANSSVCFAPVLVDRVEDRDGLLADLRDAGIEARVYYGPPVHRHPAFAGATRIGELDATDSVSGRILCLPVFQGVPDSAFETVRILAQKWLQKEAKV